MYPGYYRERAAISMEPPSSYRVSVINPYDCPIDARRIEDAVATALRSRSASCADIRVLITSDAEVQALNLQFRGIDEPTDVLTFPEDEGLPSGDIAIAVGFATRQAQAHGISPVDEIVLLSIHGSLHLAGLDDESDEERDHMVLQMNSIGSRLGLPVLESWSSVHR